MSSKQGEREVTFDQYTVAVIEAADDNKDWRLGQSAFNVLYRLRPDLSEQVRGRLLDPFYDSTKLSEFYAWVERNWTQPAATKGTDHGK